LRALVIGVVSERLCQKLQLQQRIDVAAVIALRRLVIRASIWSLVFAMGGCPIRFR
jgi:hypothetical protein